jgi:hypothetical protein
MALLACEGCKPLGVEQHNAKNLTGEERGKLALEMIKRDQTVVDLSNENGVSRKFLYNQESKAKEAVKEAFSGEANKDSDVLFYLPVTRSWIAQFVLVLVLYCHSPFRGVVAVLKDLLDYDFSIASVHREVQHAIRKTQQINGKEDLSSIRYFGHDEMFQHQLAVLAGVDLESSYCFLLSPEQQRDAETWAIRLLEAKDKGLDPEYSVADFGKGLRAGQAIALPGVPCLGDVFHVLQDLVNLTSRLERKAYTCISVEVEREKEMDKAKQENNGRSVSSKLGKARKEATEAVEVANSVAILLEWMRGDVLALVGPDLDTRRALYDFIVAELLALERFSKQRIRKVRRLLENQKDAILAFAERLDHQLHLLAAQFEIPRAAVEEMVKLQDTKRYTPAGQELERRLRRLLKHQFFALEQAVQQALSKTFRASSLIENLNGRLRSYFSLRRHIGAEYLDLLRFFFNHRRYLRSRCPERAKKSPAEVMTGEPHPHWLEMLGFRLFKRSAATA